MDSGGLRVTKVFNLFTRSCLLLVMFIVLYPILSLSLIHIFWYFFVLMFVYYKGTHFCVLCKHFSELFFMANNITADVSLNIRELMREKGIKKEIDFANELGISKQLLSNWKSRNTYDINKIEDKFPDVSKTWLLTGEGSMLKSESAAHRVESAVPMTEGKMVADDEESYQEALRKYGDSLVPEYDIEFRGGPQGLMVESGSLLGYWVIPNAPAGSFIVSMTGRSMMPAIPSGSRLLLSPYSFDRNYPTSIPFGNLFGVVTYDEEQDAYNAHIKILRRHKGGDKDATHWIARSINTEEFDDFDIPVHKVTHLYKVVSCISSLWGHWS